jgi:hypothetical protein
MVETIYAGIEHCVVHGAAIYGQVYSASAVDGSGFVWVAYIDGTAYESTNFPSPGYATRIIEGAEYEPGTACSGWTAAGVFASNPTFLWQRFRHSTFTWFTVQTSSIHPGCWTMAGGPPSSFSIYH